MAVSIRESVSGPKGRLLLRQFHGFDLIGQEVINNLIVDGARNVNASLLGGAAGYSVTQIGFGTGSTPAVIGNSALSGPPFLKAVDSVSYPAAGQVAFNFSLASGENNGMAIFEFGLLTAGGILYSRIARASALNKTSGISLTGVWTISF